jgi:hypothetical protein
MLRPQRLKEEAFMITDELKVSSETIERAVTSPRRADEAPVHFIIPWRLNTDVGHSLWQQGDDASCGSCPVD